MTEFILQEPAGVFLFSGQGSEVRGQTRLDPEPQTGL